ncbi:hypothetical protein AAG906_010083 [Vitis piasezkii]
MVPINNSYLKEHECIINVATMGCVQTTCSDILLCREAIHLTLVKLDRPASSWNNTNIGTVYGKRLRMSTPSKSQSSAMSDEDYFVWRERMERRQ